ncbi:hypothetical protein SUDANB96_06565 [Streptomyces sp. enrichment culture]
MTPRPGVWTLTSLGDAARMRAALDHIAADGGAPTPARARFLTSLTRRLRRCLVLGGAWAVTVHVRRDSGLLEVSLRPAGSPAPGPDEPLLVCPLPDPPARAGPGVTLPLSEALLRADEDTAAVLGLLDTQEELLRLHREELHKTDQGVLALHSDLEAAALAQRELLHAERTARAEAERARRLLTFLADASAAVTASLSPTAVLHRLHDMLVPDYAEHLDIWLFDEERSGPERPAAYDEENAHRVREHSAAAVVAARTAVPSTPAPIQAPRPAWTTSRPRLSARTERCWPSPSPHTACWGSSP